ncbi:hypothetical protein C1646_795920 [Rhizophagus diaphanus]|nr:hypothetical protein C1646_795920 [Rhizophagus diaphanus] [Rhizophagus sp. MUCL 43196]
MAANNANANTFVDAQKCDILKSKMRDKFFPVPANDPYTGGNPAINSPTTFTQRNYPQFGDQRLLWSYKFSHYYEDLEFITQASSKLLDSRYNDEQGVDVKNSKEECSGIKKKTKKGGQSCPETKKKVAKIKKKVDKVVQRRKKKWTKLSRDEKKLTKLSRDGKNGKLSRDKKNKQSCPETKKMDKVVQRRKKKWTKLFRDEKKVVKVESEQKIIIYLIDKCKI